jgi:DNA ligase-1
LKIKPFIEVSLTAVAIEEGTGKNAGKMGAVVFEGTDDGKFIRVACGGGWSDKDREDIWANKDAVLGQVGEVRADAATLNQDSVDVYSLRFPRFKTWRGFVAGEKL